MKKYSIVVMSFLSVATVASASSSPQLTSMVSHATANTVVTKASSNSNVIKKVSEIAREWARIKYQVKGSGKQQRLMQQLSGNAAKIVKQYPNNAEPKIWHAIVISTQAGMKGGLGALGMAKDAKRLLEKAKKINPKALNGAVYTSLGSLYYKVPGWPVGFGNDKKAKLYLKKAIGIDPNGIDANYFYGDFLIDQGKYKEAIPVLNKALRSSARPGRRVADSGRRKEIRQAIAKAKSKM